MQNFFFRAGKLFLLTMIVFAVGFISFFAAMKWVISGQEVVIPNIVGQSLEQARKALASTDLRVQVRGERYDHNVAGGKISVQLPAASTRIKKGNVINVMVSLGERNNPIPGLEGTTLRAAQLLVGQQGFELGTISEIHWQEAGSEWILTQFPTPDARELVGNKIDVLVNKGEAVDLYVMPDLVGWNMNRALAFLERNRVKVSGITYGLYQDVPMATVVKQVPEAGYPLRAGEPVRLEVSK